MARRRALVEYVVEHSLALAIGAVLALAWANSPDADRYYRFAASLYFLVNDVGMVFFFALATKEIVEATAPGGALHTWRRAALPGVAAVGGMIGPALVFIGFVNDYTTEPIFLGGWAVPCATDIAFSFLIAKAIFRDHPAIPFLLLLAIADDALGLAILAAFYPAGDLRLGTGTMLMAVALAVTFVLRRRGVRSFWPYVVGGGSLAWLALFWGGLHPALALVPVVPFLPHAARDRGVFVGAPPEARDTMSQFERWWKYPVQVVLFFFGLVNAGVRVGSVGAGTWAVLIALIAGKPIGIGVAIATAVAAGLHLPAQVGWRDLVVVGAAAGVGFTVALFFATLAYPPGPILEQMKLGALLSIGSAVIAFCAAAVLRVGRFRALLA